MMKNFDPVKEMRVSAITLPVKDELDIKSQRSLDNLKYRLENKTD